MSIPTGWKQVQVSNNPKIFYEAKIGSFVGTNGQSITIFAVTDTNGNFDIYQNTPFSVFGSRGAPIYTYNQSGKESGNRGLLTPGDFNNIRSLVKKRSFEINRASGTEGEKRSLQESNGYRSLASNTARTSTQGSTQPPAPGAAAGTPTTTQGGAGDTTAPPAEPEGGQASAGPTTSLIIAKEDLRYPLKMKDFQDMIKFQAYQLLERGQLEVSAPDPNTTTPPPEDNGEQPPSNPDSNRQAATYFTYTPESRTEKTVPVPGEKAVFISIQSPISDQNTVEWSPGNMSALDYALFGLSMSGIGGQVDIRGAGKELVGEAQRYRDRIERLAAGTAANVNNILARTDNVVLNPNLELLFNGPQLRNFTFTFKMSARGEPEAKVIKNIIRYFKYHMAVRKEQGLFLKAPHVFKIDYMHKNQENHPGINKIKFCALTNFSVDYTPMGTYMTYEDGTMVAYTLNMQFQELVPIYDDDYKEANEDATKQKVFHEIGF